MSFPARRLVVRGLHSFFRSTVALVALTVAISCGSSSDERLRVAALSEGCVLNTDCESPLVCAFRRCHTECASSRDCGEG